MAAGYAGGMTDSDTGFMALVGAHTPESSEGTARFEMEVDEEAPATSQLTVTYLRPGKPGPLSVTARVSKRGESLTVCEADVEQDGKTLVHALAAFALVGD